MSNHLKGLLLGTAAGIIDVIPMILQKLTWDANLSAFSMWIVIGFLLSITNLKIKGVLKGIAIAFIVIIPTLFIISWHNPKVLLIVLPMTFILSSLLGFTYDKIAKSANS